MDFEFYENKDVIIVTYLVYITALCLTHLNEVLNQKLSVVLADAPSLIQALV